MTQEEESCGWCCVKLTPQNVGVVDVTYCLECDGGKLLTEDQFELFGDDNDKYFDIDIDLKLAILIDDHLSIKRLPTKEEVDLYVKFLGVFTCDDLFGCCGWCDSL